MGSWCEALPPHMISTLHHGHVLLKLGPFLPLL
jgi:hypothetical protein